MLNLPHERDRHLTLTKAEWETIRDGYADIACWFRGFCAAHVNSDKTVDLPPQLHDVGHVIEQLKRRAP